MTDPDTTPRLRLPLLAAGQAQKEMTHNEALALLDCLTQATVTAVGLDAPPEVPAPGSAWVIGTAPAGVWSGHALAVAVWTADGWRFAAAGEGMAVWSLADGCVARFVGGMWHVGEVAARQVTIGGVGVVGAQRGAIAAPSGGATVDAEARIVLDRILAALRGHGLIAT